MVFSTGQLIRLWVIYIITSSLGFMLQPFFQYAGYQGWLVLLGSYLFSLLLAYCVAYLIQSSKETNFIQTGKKIVGKHLHMLILFFIILYCLLLSMLNLYDVTDFLGLIYLQNTPNRIISLIFITCAAITSYSGLKAIVYMSDGFFILISLSMIFVLPVFLQRLNPEMGIALFTHFELRKFIFSTYYVTNWIGDFVVALFFLSAFQAKQKLFKTFAIAHAIVVFVIIVHWLLILFLFGPHMSSHLRYPLLELVRYFEIGEFLENADPFVVSIWSSALILKSALLLYIASTILASFFSHKKKMKLIVTCLVSLIVWIITTVVLHYPAEYHQIIEQPIGYFLIIIKGIPILYFIVYKIRYHKQKKQRLTS